MTLAQRLREARPERFTVACLPDFFLDTIVPMAPWPVARDQMAGIVERKGGNLPTAPHRMTQGGNAANTALALARLGVRSRLIARTSPFGMHMAGLFLRHPALDLSRLRPDGELSSTVALEFGPERRNVMLGSAGSVADFAAEALEEEDWEVIAGSDAVLVSNWAHNRAGTGLAAHVLARAGRAGALTVFDSGDPSSRASEVPGLYTGVLTSPMLRVLCCNENELAYFAQAAGDTSSVALEDRARSLKRRISATLDVHTRQRALSLLPDGTTHEASVGKAEGRRATGAGDAWNAGNILGHLLRLLAPERLALANAVATAYVTHEAPVHPTLGEVAALLDRAA